MKLLFLCTQHLQQRHYSILLRDRSDYLVDRYSERVESAEALSTRVNQPTI